MIAFACAAVLFDCDGVLVDSDASVVSAWSRWAVDRDLDPQHVVPTVHGRRSADTVSLLVDAPQRRAALEQIDRYEIEDARRVRAIAGAVALTARMHRDTWAVVTSGTSALAHARLRAAGIAAPAVVVTADDVEHGKPHPEGYLTAAQRLGVPIARAVVLEDALAGIRAARAAGAKAVIGIGGRDLAGEADVVVPDLERLGWSEGTLHVKA